MNYSALLQLLNAYNTVLKYAIAKISHLTFKHRRKVIKLFTFKGPY